MIRFLAELSQRFDSAILPTPSSRFPKQYPIYELDMNPGPEEYWLAWGGHYDNFTGKEIEIYYGQFLFHVYTVDELLRLPCSLYVGHGHIAYMHLPKHPWLYTSEETEAESMISFLSSALNENNPSNNIMRGVNIPVKLAVPSLQEKLSDNISGIMLNQSFQLSLHNNDGYFDDDSLWNLFNTPARLQKSVIDNPEYEDFKPLKNGLVENTAAGFDDFRIEIADRQRSLDAQACGTVTSDKFPGITIEEKYLNKNIPVIYGVKKIKPVKLNANQYVLAEYVRKAESVIDKDGNRVDCDPLKDNVLTVRPTIEEGKEPKYAEVASVVVSGYADNKISEVIKDVVWKKANILFGETNWNVQEYQRYDETAPRINLAIESGTVNAAIQKALKSDMAFLLQMRDGKFTIRKYGAEYKTRVIPDSMITKKPEKTFSTAQQNYFSSCVVNYGFQGEECQSFLYDEKEKEAEDAYRRKVTKTFDTDLADKKDAETLAAALAERYASMKQTVKLAAGADTSEFELLDRVYCGMTINGRGFSDARYYVIKELDPAQDTMTLEEIDITDLTGENPDTANYTLDADGLYAKTADKEYEYEIEGGCQ
jgi:hypothetical protein